MRIRQARLAVIVAAAVLLLVPPGAAAAGEAADYPEFPYPATDYQEQLRGQFHFSPRAGWMNDINAPLYYEGRYHLFFQHNPHGLQWDTMHWGHATSPDMVHWTQQPIALEPGVHPGNLFSGGGVVDTADTSGLAAGGHAPIVVFTGTDGVRVNYSTDGARTFQPYDGGRPVIDLPANSRDPKVFWHAVSRQWILVVWSDAGGNGVRIYSSPDLLHWAFRSRYAASWLFECPDMFPLPVDGTGEVKWVLSDAAGEYVVGSFDGTSFVADSPEPQSMDHGRTGFTGTFYAPLTFANLPDDRIVQMAWMPGNHGGTWTGNASFPVQLGLRRYPEGLRVTRTPVAELAALRGATTTWTGPVVTPDGEGDPLRGADGDTYELTAEFDVAASTAERFGFQLHVRADGGYDRAVLYDREAGTLDGVPMPAVDGKVRVQLLVDRGQLEVFGDGGRVSITDNVDFDGAPASRGLRTVAEGGSVRVTSLRMTSLASAWGDGQPTLGGNLRGPWHAVGGSWHDAPDGKRGDADGDGFYLSDQSGTDFTYEADVRLDTAAAAAITFRASPDARRHYTVNVDAAGLVKLWRPGRDIAVHPAPIARNRFYHVRVVAEGARFRVFLDHGQEPVIDAVDDAYASGLFGVNVFAGGAVISEVNVGAAGFRTGLDGPWAPVAGSWTVPGAGLQGRRTGDGFDLSATRATDFRYEGDVRILAGRAAGLTFRASADATGHYTASLDTEGYVKLWRPGRDIAVHPAPIIAGRTYHLAVVAAGRRIQVFLDHGADPVIDAVDDTYAAGLTGVNVFDGVATMQDVMLSDQT
jgi:fructan beta-fructosidase